VVNVPNLAEDRHKPRRKRRESSHGSCCWGGCGLGLGQRLSEGELSPSRAGGVAVPVGVGGVNVQSLKQKVGVLLENTAVGFVCVEVVAGGWGEVDQGRREHLELEEERDRGVERGRRRGSERIIEGRW